MTDLSYELKMPQMMRSDIEAHELARDELGFLATMLAAMNNELSVDRKHNFREVRSIYESRGADIEKLKREGYVIEHRIGRGRGDLTYTVTPKGRSAIDSKLSSGPGVGDIGDGMPHRYGADYVERWLSGYPNIVKIQSFVEPPVELDEEALIDLIAWSESGEPSILVEVEGGMSTPEKERHGMNDVRPGGNDYQSLLHDHDVMAMTKARVKSKTEPGAVWVVRNKAAGERVVGALADHGRIDPKKSFVQKRYRQESPKKFRRYLRRWGCPGMDAIYTFTTVRDELCGR